MPRQSIAPGHSTDTKRRFHRDSDICARLKYSCLPCWPFYMCAATHQGALPTRLNQVNQATQTESQAEASRIATECQSLTQYAITTPTAPRTALHHACAAISAAPQTQPQHQLLPDPYHTRHILTSDISPPKRTLSLKSLPPPG